MNEKTRLIETCREYCTGCGLCGAVNNKKFTEDEKHFSVSKSWHRRL